MTGESSECLRSILIAYRMLNMASGKVPSGRRCSAITSVSLVDPPEPLNAKERKVQESCGILFTGSRARSETTVKLVPQTV